MTWKRSGVTLESVTHSEIGWWFAVNRVTLSSVTPDRFHVVIKLGSDLFASVSDLREDWVRLHH